MRRRLREAVRSNRIKTGWDAIFIARRGSENASYRELKRAADNLLRRSRMVEPESDAVASGSRAEGRS